MRFQQWRALRSKFPNAEAIVQVRIITKMNSTMDIEGPISEEVAGRIFALAAGTEVDDVTKKVLTDRMKGKM